MLLYLFVMDSKNISVTVTENDALMPRLSDS